jgi:tRNA pseudouridine38-40 synthase
MHSQRVPGGVRIKAVVAYDGTDYHGFQRQAPEHEPSIQGTLEAALSRIEQPGTVLGAGRTDAGVHASGQVIAFDVNWRHGLASLQRALNAVLPDSVAVLELEQAADRFHPRFDATSREYRYNRYTGRVRQPLLNRYALYVLWTLDVAAMQSALATLLGEHDFGAFGQPTAGESTIRSMFRADVTAAGPQIAIELQANGFLYRMVRRIVGTLIPIGRGELSGSEFAAILQSADPNRAGPAVPAHGLCLTHVNYE